MEVSFELLSTTHRFGSETQKAVGELHEDAIGHDVLHPSN